MFQVDTNDEPNGYFKNYFDAFKRLISPENRTDFSQYSTDIERVRLLQKILPICEHLKKEANFGKDVTFAMECKEKANAEFIRGDITNALRLYTDALLKIPFNEDDSKEYAVILANRSAALYRSEKFEEAIRDVDAALTHQYPKELRYKILERKSKSLLALKQHGDALLTFRCTLQALDDAKLPIEKKNKLQKDIQIMLSLLTRPTTQQGHINAFVEGEKNAKSVQDPVVSGKKNSKYPAMTEKVTIMEGSDVGRYASATKDIEAGDTILVEKSYCSVLLAEYGATHCSKCCKRLINPYPCPGCSTAVFCNKICQDEAFTTYHQYECQFARSLYLSGASVTVIMALRIVTQKSLSYFLSIANSLKNTNKGEKYKSDDYLSVYHLVRHEQLRTVDDFLERTAMAVFLLRCLEMTSYFKLPGNTETSLNDKLYIGSLILRHLQAVQFNAHEISELETDCTETLDKATSRFIGGGLFPTLSLFNHSCEAAVVRYFSGTTVVFRTMRPLRPGELVNESYGQNFTTKDRAERQKTLKSQYWFDCQCQACEEDWPTLAKMNRNVMRFRCNPGEPPICFGVIEVPKDATEFMPECNLCHRRTNILRGLKTLQDTDGMFRQAQIDEKKGNVIASLNLYLEILSLLGEHLKPPFYDYHLCQQAIRKCMLTLGNKYVKDYE